MIQTHSNPMDTGILECWNAGIERVTYRCLPTKMQNGYPNRIVLTQSSTHDPGTIPASQNSSISSSRGMTVIQKLIVVAFLSFCTATVRAGERFESAAIVDGFDFTRLRDAGKALRFDTETAEGNIGVLEHVLLTGATTVLWRNCSGATMRYQSREERYPLVEAPFDKRRLPDNRPVSGWLRFYQAEPDVLRTVFAACRERGIQAGVHWPFEETHWTSWTFGGWNFEHPQYWSVNPEGHVWAGRCSLAYPEVVAHKLRLTDELIERGMDHLFIDTWRNGGWKPPREYVEPELARWRKTYHSEPPTAAKDPRWCKFVSETNHNYFTKLRQQLDASGRRIRLMVGVSDLAVLSDAPDEPLLARGVDWRRLVDEGVVDTVVVMSVKWNPKRPFESTREIYRSILGFCRGKCQVLFPVQAYDFTKHGMPSYRKATKLEAHVVAGNLLRMAWEEGANGICMECVDYNNYTPAVRAEMQHLLNGPCREVSTP